MSYSIEQTREQTNDAFALLSRVDLDQVRLVESSAVCKISPSSERVDLFFDIDFSPESAMVDGKDLVVRTRFVFDIRDKDKKDGSTLISVDALFEARYSILAPDYTPTEAQIEAFRRGNAIFNCWPYFREYIHNVFTRMGFPPPPVPFLRLVPKRETTEDTGSLALRPGEGKAPTRARPKRRLSAPK